MDRGDPRLLCFLLLGLAIAFGGSAWCQPLPVCDDFETPIAQAGTYLYPADAENEWLTLNDGKMWGYSAYLSDAADPPSGQQSFLLDSDPWARQMDYFRLTEIPDKFSYEASVRVDPDLGWVGLVGFMARNGFYTGVWNHFRIDAGYGEVSFQGQDVVRVGDYTPGAWCTVGADLDFASLTADLWLDGNCVAQGVPIAPKELDDPYVGHVVLDKWGVATDDYLEYPYLSWANVVYFDDVAVWEASAGTLEVEINITPGGNPNSVNLKSKGVLPVAVFSSESFDATDIDPETVTLAGATVAAKGKHGKLMARAEDVDGDGLLDMMLHFAVQEIDPAQVQDGFAVLTGSTYGGLAFEGSDVFVPRPSPRGAA